MPFTIKQIKDNKYKVCKKDNPNICFSKKGLSKRTANKQMKAIIISENKKGKGKPEDLNLYNDIKKEIYTKNPKHSLYRSAQIVKEYKKQGGEFENEDNNNKMNIPLWLKQKWITLNDYLKGNIVPCGQSKIENEYPLCRPLEIAKKLNKTQIKKMIKEKQELQEKPLITKKILKTDKFNIKPTLSGLGNNKFINQLNKINLKPEDYLLFSQELAKHNGYNPDLLKISKDNVHKLEYNNVPFGRVGYNDYIIYSWLEYNNKLPKGTAQKKRINYRKRAYKVMKETNDKFKASSLAFYLNW